VPSPKRSASPRATSTHCNVDSLKVLDPERPIREADVDSEEAIARVGIAVMRSR
jgi:hypothetical protein